MSRQKQRTRLSPLEAELLRELAALYDELDAANQGHSCAGTTRCCRFAITGREPYVTSIELLALRRAIAARGGALSVNNRALPLTPQRKQERCCPLLTRQARCAAYQARPLGCRSFWCKQSTQTNPVSHQQLLELVGRLKQLAARHVAGGDLGRPLVKALREHF